MRENHAANRTQQKRRPNVGRRRLAMEPAAREEATTDSATAAHQRLPVVSTQQDLGVLAAARAAGSPVLALPTQGVRDQQRLAGDQGVGLQRAATQQQPARIEDDGVGTCSARSASVGVRSHTAPPMGQPACPAHAWPPPGGHDGHAELRDAYYVERYGTDPSLAAHRYHYLQMMHLREAQERAAHVTPPSARKPPSCLCLPVPRFHTPDSLYTPERRQNVSVLV